MHDDDAVAALRRWEAFGAVWRVLGRGPDGVTVAMCRCDDGEEMARFTSADPGLEEFLAGRTSSAD
nr:hypothetical protein [Beutenbergia cavernae]